MVQPHNYNKTFTENSCPSFKNVTSTRKLDDFSPNYSKRFEWSHYTQVINNQQFLIFLSLLNPTS